MQEVFIPNPSFDKEGYDVMTMFRHKNTAGEIGIEIECEGNKFPKDPSQLPKIWSYHHDGSLRGKDNAEYVLNRPVKFSEVDNAIKDLFSVLSAYGTILDDSNRTSVHVHLNVQRFHMPRLTAFLGLYFSIEELLTEWCGDHRVGNLFCLRAKDAPAIVSKIKRWIVSDGSAELSEGLHYSGMNVNALAKFGSLEIRSLRGVSDPSLIMNWVGVLRRLYEVSAEYKDPRSLTENFSGNDPIDYLKGILAGYYDVIRDGVSMTDEEVRSSMYSGIRLAQDLCYCRDWSKYKEADLTKNPFGRNKKSLSSLEMLINQQIHTIQPSTAGYYMSAPPPTTSQPYTPGWEQHFVNLVPAPQGEPGVMAAGDASEEPEEDHFDNYNDEYFENNEEDF